MKARFLALAALVLGLASCQNDFDGNAVAGGEVNFQLAVTTGGVETRAGERGEADSQNAKDSAFGAVDYFQATNWADVDLRYILEVYDQADSYDNAEPVKDRMVKIVDAYEPVTFDLRLIPNRNYHFVVFADFVANGSHALSADEQLAVKGLHHDATNLQAIKILADAINEECTDAYFATADIKIENSAAQGIVLKRPYGKVRVVATDLAELNLNVDPKAVKVVYTTIQPDTFNAVNGKVSEVKEGTQEFTRVYGEISKTDLSQHTYTAGYDAMVENGRHTHMTLFTDYILATEEQRDIQFDLYVYDDAAMQSEIKHTEFSTMIPVQRNYLTTIIGNVLTTATEIDVTIDDNFANKDNQYYVFEAFVNGGEVTLTEDYVIGRPLFVEADAVLNLNGHSIKNAEGNADTDVIIVRKGAKLTINGEGTIEAVSGNDGYAIISEGELVINGGTYKAGVDADGAANAVIYARGEGKVFVNGGYFPNDNNSTFVLNKKDADRATTTIEVRGGHFCNFDPANNAAENAGTCFVADGYVSLPAEDNCFEVVELAGEITLPANLTPAKSLVVLEGKSLKLNLGGFNIINAGATEDLGVADGIIVYGKLEINGEGTVQGKTRSVWARGNTNAEVTINGGNYVGAVVEGGCEVIYASGNGKITINGGTFEAANMDDSSFAAPQYAVLNLHGNGAAGCDIKVYGGSFKNFNPADNISENPKYNFCAEGCITLTDGDWFRVVSGAVVTNADEFKAAASNANLDYIVVAADLDFGTEYVNVINYDKIILGNGYKFNAGGKTTTSYALGVEAPVNVEIHDLVLNGGGGIYVSGGANVEVNNVTLKVKYSKSGRHMFYVNNATLTVNSGEFEVLNTGYKYFSMQNNARAYVKGGTFEDLMAKGQEPVYTDTGAQLEISGGKFQVGTANYKFDPTPWLAEGYQAIRVGNYMEVSSL
ncbi:MAG: hypothetical protein IKT66_02810 [Alistipes sp.]|nr:hypothetical protein [Alistipes sp.]